MPEVKKKWPFFTIVTCTRNSGKFIRRNLASVGNQTFNNYEQVLIDGHSSDNTRQITKEFTGQDIIKLSFFSLPPRGISNAFNYGIKKSKGKYLLFLNSDDSLFDKNVLRDVHRYLLKNKDKDWIYGVINVVEENGDRIGSFPKYAIFKTGSSFLLKFLNYIPHQAVFMKRDIFKKFGLFDDNLSSKMDYEYWLRIANKTRWGFFDRVISNYTIRKGAKTSSRKNRQENEANLKIVQRRYLDVSEYFLAKTVHRFVRLIGRTTR